MQVSDPYPRTITHLSDADLWASLRPRPRRPGAAHLAEAIAAGRRGRSAQAYAAMACYHRESLADEWAHLRREALAVPPPDPGVLRDTLNRKIATWHNFVYQFEARIDWAPADLSPDCIAGLNHLFWLQPVVNAFIRNPGDERLRAFLIDVLDQNYYGLRRHPRWGAWLSRCVFNGLCISARWQALLPSYLALIHAGDVSARTMATFLKSFLGYARELDRELVDFVPANNGFAVSTGTLFHLARAFPEFGESPRWDRKAVQFTVDQATEGFFDDGGSRERVWGYGIMTLGSLARAYALAARCGGLGGHEREVHATLRKACQWYIKTSGPAPAYAFPTYGDAGWSAHDRLPTIQAMARCLPEAERDPMLGVDRTRGYLLPDSGFAVLRNGDGPTSTYANLSVGEFAGWHSHWDLLSLNLWALGEPLLEELCRFGPYENPLDTLFRQPESHNLTLIDGMVYDSRLVKGEDVHWYSDDTVEYLSAYHRAYRYFVYGRDAVNVSPNIEAKIRRTVLLVKDPGYVVVLDAVEDLNSPIFNRAVSQYWHAPTPFRSVGPGAVRTEGLTACLVVQGRTEGLHRQDAGKDFGGEEIAHLGVGYERYSLRVRRWMPINHKGITGFATVLYPFKGRMPKVSVTPIPVPGLQPWRQVALRIVTPAGIDEIVLDPERRRGFAWHRRPMAARACVRLGNGRGSVNIP